MKKIIVLMGLLTVSAVIAAGERPSIDKFFEGQRVEQVSVSPDGHYLALVIRNNDVNFVAVMDRQKKTPPTPVLRLNEGGHPSFNWCRWAKPDRLVCSVLITENSADLHRIGPRVYYSSTRLIAVDASGANNKQLIANSTMYGGQKQDRIIDWLHDDPDNVLIDLPDNLQQGYGATDVYRLNIRTGKIAVEESARKHVGGFATDGKGHVRLAGGVDQDAIFRMYAKPKGSDSWKEIVKREVKLEEESQYLDPQAVIPDTDEAYATGDYKGFDALWSVSLTGASEPQMLFSQPGADVYPLFGPDRQLLGVAYDTDKHGVKYFDSRAQLLQDVADNIVPNHTNELVDFSRDMQIAVVRSQADNDPPFFSVLDLSSHPPKFSRVGSSYPALAGLNLATVEPVSFAASDGVTVNGYLTRPGESVNNSKTPLIVLPHGGPYARDRWGFDSWVQYLASRGYTVLQIEFRGSTGYGNDWFKAGFADWGGKPYSDVIDGTKWALSKGYGDPSHTCLVGTSFGGYMALLAATRNHESKLFRCAVSIAGVSDLRELIKDRQWYNGWKLVKQSVGTDDQKLRENSPAEYAVEVDIPIMMIHGDQDSNVKIDEAKLMDDALKKANKPHELVVIKGADHFFRDDAYLKEMFTSMSAFLQKNLEK